jgi:hypothetical protein
MDFVFTLSETVLLTNKSHDLRNFCRDEEEEQDRFCHRRRVSGGNDNILCLNLQDFVLSRRPRFDWMCFCCCSIDIADTEIDPESL